jgi:hypothetical protein
MTAPARILAQSGLQMVAGSCWHSRERPKLGIRRYILGREHLKEIGGFSNGCMGIDP